MNYADIHSIPPSSSSLLALSSLNPPSPILAAIGTSCSTDYIPILLFQDLQAFATISRPTSSLSPSPKLPVHSNAPTLPSSKSWVTFDPRDDVSMNTPPIPSVHHSPQVQAISPQLVRQVPISPPLQREEPFSLPQNLFWLQNTAIQLMIDQEGFRAVYPTFKLVGLLKQARGWDSPEGGLALFRPIKRETFRFHYAPLDGLPVLRRLTAANDESRDYISRQASLSLKTNGVYTVQGVETSHLPASCGEVGDSKLRWKFDYLVGDRLEHSGKILNGEKTLTPLTFMCSPWLLHRSQARKMKFMHIVKKSVTTKLIAEKLEPPMFSNPPAKPPANKWTLHRRVQSSSPHTEESKPKKKAGSLRRTVDRRGPRDENQEPSCVVRRRRASSAGEGRRPVQSEYLVGKHIIPPARLAELLNTDYPDVDARREGLSPAPWHGRV